MFFSPLSWTTQSYICPGGGIRGIPQIAAACIRQQNDTLQPLSSAPKKVYMPTELRESVFERGGELPVTMLDRFFRRFVPGTRRPCGKCRRREVSTTVGGPGVAEPARHSCWTTYVSPLGSVWRSVAVRKNWLIPGKRLGACASATRPMSRTRWGGQPSNAPFVQAKAPATSCIPQNAVNLWKHRTPFLLRSKKSALYHTMVHAPCPIEVTEAGIFARASARQC